MLQPCRFRQSPAPLPAQLTYGGREDFYYYLDVWTLDLATGTLRAAVLWQARTPRQKKKRVEWPLLALAPQGFIPAGPCLGSRPGQGQTLLTAREQGGPKGNC